MKRNIVIAGIAAAAVIGGTTATAVAISGDDGARAGGSSVRTDDDRGADRDDDGHGDDRGNTADGGRDDDAAEVPPTGISAAEAIDAALAEVSGTAVSADLEDDDGRAPFWDVDILGADGTWHSVRIGTSDGKVLGSHTETEDGDDRAEAAAAEKAGVTAKEAAEAAAAKGAVTSVDLDDDGRGLAWEVTTANGGWTVAAGSGRLAAAAADDQDDDLDDDEHGDEHGDDD
ncbi:PepSY domain-containing protein [Streptomyces sp. GC420]|uniref:PepSY domain-containing protein n=1 Tax=Streptomyces sp. GC420 TaxID=2697568 RepID=UPI0014150A2A|nr:PepSY domain-containing protein [Streptomyces sp. GC420]NBM17748.1 peptidase propeptide and YpeB domain protein [Streptomyces sp. GC420]